MSEQREELAQARQLGCLKAERLDQKLRAAEQRERELRLARLAWDGLADEPVPGRAAEACAGEVWRLRQDVARLAAFHQAVLRSRAWRLVQLLRRPFGRAW